MRVALLLALGVLSTACSLVVDTSKRDPCSTHAECTERYGEPSACVEANCVKLLTEDCTEVLPEGALLENDTILFGLMATLKGDSASYGIPTKEGAQLAFDEVETLAGGIAGIPGEPRQRHVAMLVCDHGADPKKVARHLAEEVKVPAIIGPSFSGVTLKVLDVTVPANTLVISATATSPALTDAPDNGLFWRTCPSDVVQTEAMKYLLVQLVDSLHAAGTLPDDRDPRIAILYKDDSAGRGLQVGATTTFEGPNPAPPVEADYQEKYPNPDDVSKGFDWSRYANGVIENEPDVIMPLGTTEFVTDMLPTIESGWHPSAPPPWYILPEGDRVGELVTYVNGNSAAALPERVVGTAPGPRKSMLYRGFADRFGGEFDQRDPGNLAEFAYDAAYLLLYATAITGQRYPTGGALAEALKNVTCGRNPVQVGPQKFSNYFKLAQDQQCIDFEGASGPLDFDNATGEAVSDIAVWCLRSQANGVSYDPPLDSYYSASEGRIVWKNDTPIDFSRTDWCDTEGK